VKWTPGLTVAHVQGHGKQQRIGVYRGVQYRVLSPKVMIEIAADDNKVDDLVKILIEIARTGESGDGRIFVLPVEEAYHVRTGFMG
jgi:nitrogen regulatory protein P-II 1